MSNCDCQENIKKPIEDGPTVAAKAAEDPIEDGLIITTVAATAVGIFFGLRAIGAVQHDALITPTLLVWLMSLPVWKI